MRGGTRHDQNGNRRTNEHVFGLMWQGRRLAGMVVSSNGEHPSIRRGTKGIAMLDDIHGAINTGALAVPHAENTIELSALEQVGLLAAPDRRCSEVLIHTGLEVDIVLLEPGLGFPHGLVDRTQWRATIARDEGRGIQPPLLVPLMLQHRQSDQSLNTCHIGPGSIQRVLVIETDLAKQCGLILTHDPYPLDLSSSGIFWPIDAEKFI